MYEKEQVRSFNEYQIKTKETAIYVQAIAEQEEDAGKRHLLEVLYLGLGLGEAGEIQGKIKKILRDHKGEVLDLPWTKRHEIIEELGDLLWYVSELSAKMGFSLQYVATTNVAKLKKRAVDGTLGGSGDKR